MDYPYRPQPQDKATKLRTQDIYLRLVSVTRRVPSGVQHQFTLLTYHFYRQFLNLDYTLKLNVVQLQSTLLAVVGKIHVYRQFRFKIGCRDGYKQIRANNVKWKEGLNVPNNVLLDLRDTIAQGLVHQLAKVVTLSAPKRTPDQPR